MSGRVDTIEVFLDNSWHLRRQVNDEEIIERAVYIGEVTGQKVILAAGDYQMLYRAGAAGLTAALMPEPNGRAGGPQRCWRSP